MTAPLAFSPSTLAFDWSAAVLVLAGCAIAWALSEALANALSRSLPRTAGCGEGERRTAPISPAAARFRLFLFEGLIALTTVLMVALLVISASAVFAAGEAWAMTLSSVLAVAATPLLAVLLEAFEMPCARRFAAAVDPPAPAIPISREPRRLAA